MSPGTRVNSCNGAAARLSAFAAVASGFAGGFGFSDCYGFENKALIEYSGAPIKSERRFPSLIYQSETFHDVIKVVQLKQECRPKKLSGIFHQSFFPLPSRNKSCMKRRWID